MLPLINEVLRRFPMELTICAIFQDLFPNAEGLWPSNVSMNGGSGPWYMALTQFETIFLYLVMFNIAILRWVEILPVNLNNLFHGDPSGRRKRDVVDQNKDWVKARTQNFHHVDSLLLMIQKMDENNCFLQTLCHLSPRLYWRTEPGNVPIEIPNEIQDFFKILPVITTRLDEDGPDEAEAMGPFKTAINVGRFNQTNCPKYFHQCPLSVIEIQQYVDLVWRH